jgi:uncharacterized protein (TIGR00369 family)
MQTGERKRTVCWDDPVVGARDPAKTSGLDYLRSIKDGSTSPPPAAKLVGYRLCDVDHGRAVFELDPDECHYNPFSTVHGGIISTLLDTAMTSCVLSTLDRGVSCATAEVKVNFIRPVTADTGTVTCEGRPIHIGKRLATAEATLKDGNGRLCAHAVSTILIFDAGSA